MAKGLELEEEGFLIKNIVLWINVRVNVCISSHCIILSVIALSELLFFN
jgi:hypothetical protein